jgi:hypothetical protein
MSRLAVPLKFAVDIAAQDQRFRARRTGQSPIEYAAAKKVKCKVCGKRIKQIGEKDHMRDAHRSAA